MYEQRETSAPRKHHVDYRDRGNFCTAKTRNVHGVVDSFNPLPYVHSLAIFPTKLSYPRARRAIPCSIEPILNSKILRALRLMTGQLLVSVDMGRGP